MSFWQRIFGRRLTYLESSDGFINLTDDNVNELVVRLGRNLDQESLLVVQRIDRTADKSGLVTIARELASQIPVTLVALDALSSAVLVTGFHLIQDVGLTEVLEGRANAMDVLQFDATNSDLRLLAWGGSGLANDRTVTAKQATDALAEPAQESLMLLHAGARNNRELKALVAQPADNKMLLLSARQARRMNHEIQELISSEQALIVVDQRL